LKDVFLEASDTKGALRLLRRGARLPFERSRQRVLLHQAAVLYVEPLDADERTRAIRVFTEIFEDQATDTMAATLVDRFCELLETAGEKAKLASFMEDQGRHHARLGNPTEAGVWWLRAAALWETQAAWEKATAAYEQGGALGSDAPAAAEQAFDSLARIHAERGEWTKALEALEWLCSHSSGDAQDRRTLPLADALVELGQAEQARTRLEQVLSTSPAPEVARDVRARLITLYRRDENWRRLADTLRAQGDSSEGQTKAALFSEAATVLSERLHQIEEAAQLLEVGR
jgi:tetratricopeptide (TPR) repeat protein